MNFRQHSHKYPMASPPDTTECGRPFGHMQGCSLRLHFKHTCNRDFMSSRTCKTACTAQQTGPSAALQLKTFLLRWSQGAGASTASQLSLFCCTGPRELDQGIKSLDPQKDPTATNEDAPVRIQVQRQLAQVCRGLDSDPGLQFALSLCREGFTVTNNEHAAQSFCWLLWPVAVLRDHADRAGCWNSSSAPG